MVNNQQAGEKASSPKELIIAATISWSFDELFTQDDRAFFFDEKTLSKQQIESTGMNIKARLNAFQKMVDDEKRKIPYSNYLIRRNDLNSLVTKLENSIEALVSDLSDVNYSKRKMEDNRKYCQSFFIPTPFLKPEEPCNQDLIECSAVL